MSIWKTKIASIFPHHYDNRTVNFLERLVSGSGTDVLLKEALASIKGSEMVLDIGAGSGRVSIPIARSLTGGHVIALDISPQMLSCLEAEAKKKGIGNKIRPLLADAASSGLENESVDLVVSNNVLHELADPQATLLDAFRVLKPGGKIILCDFAKNLTWLLMKPFHGKSSHGPLDTEEVKALLDRAGFDSVRVQRIRLKVVASAIKPQGNSSSP